MVKEIQTTKLSASIPSICTTRHINDLLTLLVVVGPRNCLLWRICYFLLKDYFIQKKGKRRLILYAFERDPVKIYDKAVKIHSEITVEEPWDPLNSRFCNKAQPRAFKIISFA